MKKTVINLAIASCFAFGVSLAQAAAHAKAANAQPHGHGQSQPDGHAHNVADDYFKKATISGQTQNVKVDDKGVRLPYNMAQDFPSVGESEQGVRAMHGQANPYHAKLNKVNPPVESDEFWGMIGTNNPSGSTHNVYPTSSGRNFYQGR